MPYTNRMPLRNPVGQLTSRSFPNNKQHKEFCKEQLIKEQELGTNLNDTLDKLNTYALVGMLIERGNTTMDTTTLTNTDGTSWSEEGKAFVKEMTSNPEALQKMIKDTEQSLSLSIAKQKFWIYTHNLNEEKSKKYNKKIVKIQQEILDELMFVNTEADVVLGVEHQDRTEVVKNQGALVSLGREFKKWNELTTNLYKNFHLIPRK